MSATEPGAAARFITTSDDDFGIRMPSGNWKTFVSPIVAGIMGRALKKGFGGMTDGVKKRAESLR